jgi:ubiquitin C-terminal hydrolase
MKKSILIYQNKIMKGLKYSRNSCYIDSVLLAIFFNPNRVVKKYILEANIDDIVSKQQVWVRCHSSPRLDHRLRILIQEELYNIYNIIQGAEQRDEMKTCEKLRKILSHCQNLPERFDSSEMQDSGEFLTYLFNLFQIDVAKIERITVVGKSINGKIEICKKVSNFIDEHASPIVDVSSEFLRQYKHINLRNCLSTYDDSVLCNDNLYKDENGLLYNRRIELFRVLSSPYIVFYVHRVHYSENNAYRLYTRVIAPESINLDTRQLELSAIILHRNYHYISYLKKDESWYFYDDNPSSGEPKFEFIGNYQKMLEYEYDPEKEGTLYFYN